MFVWSGQQDLNLRPSGPKPDALPDCAMPRLDLAHILAGEPVTTSLDMRSAGALDTRFAFAQQGG